MKRLSTEKFHKSLHGSNSLRGGFNEYNPSCLQGNWLERRLDPTESQDVSYPYQLRESNAAPWAAEYDTIYRLSYDYGEWASRQHTTPYMTNILKHDDSAIGDNASTYRSSYRNPLTVRVEEQQDCEKEWENEALRDKHQRRLPSSFLTRGVRERTPTRYDSTVINNLQRQSVSD